MESVEFICMTTYENMDRMVKKAEVRSFAKRIVKEFKDGLALAESEDRKAWEAKRKSKPYTPVMLTIKNRQNAVKINIQKRHLQYPLPSYKPKVTGYRRSRTPDDNWAGKPHCSNSVQPQRGGWRKMSPNELTRIEELELSNVENISRIDDLEEALDNQQELLTGVYERISRTERRLSGQKKLSRTNLNNKNVKINNKF